jgi:hypothetical protein
MSKWSDWIKLEQGKHKCTCGCNKHITIIRDHYWAGIPKFLHGHNAKNTHIVPYIVKPCGFCSKNIERRAVDGNSKNIIFCNRTHRNKWLKTKDGKIFARNELFKHGNKSVWSKDSKQKWVKNYFDNVKRGDFSRIEQIPNVDVTRVHKCKYKGCKHFVFSIWSYCRRHENLTNEGKLKHATFNGFRLLREKGLLLKGLPLELKLTMYLLVKVKEELDECRSD